MNLGVHLVRDAFKGAFDMAAVLTNDTELLEPIRIITQELQRLAVILERFSLNCSEYISDNDLNRSSDDNSDRKRTPFPKLGEFPADADWKALDFGLVDRVMSLPNRLSAAERTISFWWDVRGDDDMQNETDRKAGSCGLESWLTAAALCDRYKILQSNLVEDSWNFVATLQEERAGRRPVLRPRPRKSNVACRCLAFIMGPPMPNDP